MFWHFTSIGKTALLHYGGEYGFLPPNQDYHIHLKIPENFSLIRWQTAEKKEICYHATNLHSELNKKWSNHLDIK